MWQTTVNLTCKLSSTPTTSPNYILRPSFLHSINVNLTLTSRSHTLISSSSNTTAAISDHVKSGIQNSDLSRSISTTATDLSSVSSAALSVSKTRSNSTTATDLSAVSSSALSLLKTRDVVDAARHYGRCYWELSKARLSMLVVATSGTGYILGSGSVIDYAGLGLTCAGTMMVAASANSLNQVFEIKNDARMKRTMQRPLPSGRLTRQHAVTWACSVGLAGTALLACKANVLAAGLGISTLFLYAFVYTPLKQVHPINTWVGAVVGALPPLLGWAAASGQVSMNGMLLPAALYFWQIPHFMALAYLCRNDYAAGGFKMLSLADASGHRTALVALRNCIYLVPLGFLAYDWGITSGWFCLESSLLAAAISATALSFYRDRTMKSARKMFHASLLYLPVFMSGLIFHRITYNENKEGLSLDSSMQNFEVPISSEIMFAEENDENKRKHSRVKRESRAPVSYASVAPFPFLPAPSYSYP